MKEVKQNSYISYVEDHTSIRDENILLCISECKSHFINWFYEFELGLKFTF